jgi:5-methylthioadenosine/S-adenosylhomocysteine deaminase
MSLVISGHIVPLSLNSDIASSEKDTFHGKVWIGDDGRIARITRGNASGPSMQLTSIVHFFEDEPRVR